MVEALARPKEKYATQNVLTKISRHQNVLTIAEERGTMLPHQAPHMLFVEYVDSVVQSAKSEHEP